MNAFDYQLLRMKYRRIEAPVNDKERDEMLIDIHTSTSVIAERLHNHMEDKEAHHRPPCKSLSKLWGFIGAGIMALLIGGGSWLLSQVVEK
jgi:hypothetical protein